MAALAYILPYNGRSKHHGSLPGHVARTSRLTDVYQELSPTALIATTSVGNASGDERYCGYGHPVPDPSSGSTRREWLTGVSAAMSASSVASAQTGGNVKRPNIVLIISDQFRCDCVGAMGLNPMNLTPNLDAMAGHGVLFRSAFSNQPVCAPARGSIFTGQYPSRHGVWHNGSGLAENATTLATALGQAGYSTNYIGKWHLAPGEGRPRDEVQRPRGAGPSRRFPGFVGSVERSWSGPPTLTREIFTTTTASPSISRASTGWTS